MKKIQEIIRKNVMKVVERRQEYEKSEKNGFNANRLHF